MSTSIAFAEDLKLPLSAVSQTFAFLAKRGAGKTYGASKLAEGMLDAGAQVVVLDCVGNWWGLRLAADGKSPGIPIPVFGGERGDLPLEAAGGASMARLIVDRGISAVLDVSTMRKHEQKRFAREFAEELIHAKRSAKSPLHLVIEEAQRFVPQRTIDPEDGRMLGAFEDLIKLGRNFGIGATLISQRPQSVNKDALSQTECLVVLQVNEALARKAIEEWIVEQGLDVKALVKELPGLGRGEAFVWSPSWLKCTMRTRIGAKRTFDASSTPELGQAKAPATRLLAPVELEELRGAIAATIEKAKAADPKLLQARVRELEKLLAAAQRALPAAQRVEKLPTPTVSIQGFSRALERVLVAVKKSEGLIHSAIREVNLDAPAPAKPTEPGALTLREAARKVGLIDAKPYTSRGFVNAAAFETLPKGARGMMAALKLFTRRQGLTRSELATFSGIAVSGGTFAKYLSLLRTGNYICEGSGGRLGLTDSGAAAVGHIELPRSTEDLIALWNTRLPAGARNMLEHLVRVHPRGFTRHDLGSLTSIEPSGGTFAKYLSTLHSAGLVEKHGGELFAAASLFLHGEI